MQNLLEMLTYKRPHGSVTELEFIERYIEPLGEHPNVIAYDTDEAGNIFVTTDPASKTLFTAHVDTVHSKDGKQIVTHDKNINLVYLDDKAALTTNCLGADDTAGMWLLLEMIDAGVPGTYAFFRGEERGGIGSRHAAQTMPEFFMQFDRAVAFDRRGTGDVITHQAAGRCCSDLFAQALADELGKGNVDYYRADTGIFTDTANLTDLIGECTNLSCGYDSEHSVNETLDLEHLLAMRDALIVVDWEHLPTSRKPGEIDPQDWGGSWFRDYRDPVGSGGYVMTEDIMKMNYKELVAYVKKADPADVAEVIYDLIDEVLYYQENAEDIKNDRAYDNYYQQAEGWQ